MAEELTLEEQHEALKAEHAKLQADHEALKAQLPPQKPAYEYADDECRPVPMQIGSKCDKCGWEFGGKEPKDKEPHAVA